jgi:hypothetical protein
VFILNLRAAKALYLIEGGRSLESRRPCSLIRRVYIFRPAQEIAQHHTYPTQSGIRVSQGLGGVRRTAQARKQERFMPYRTI